MSLFLQIQEPGSSSTRQVQAQAGAKIGRSRECDVVIADPKVGRQHLEIVEQGGAFSLVDLGSKNGTRINGAEIAKNQPVAIQHGIQVNFGDTFLTIGVGSAPPEVQRPASGEHTIAVGGTPSRSAPKPAGGDSLSDGTIPVQRPKRPGAAPATPAATPPADQGEGTQISARPRPGAAASKPPKADDSGHTMQAPRPRAATPPPAAPKADDSGHTMQAPRPRAATPPPDADQGENTIRVGPARGPRRPQAPPPAEPAAAAPPPAAAEPAPQPAAAPDPAPEAAQPPAPAAANPTPGPSQSVKADRPTLVLVNPNFQTTKSIPTCPFTIGRGDDQNWQVSDDRISRNHAVIEYDGSDFNLRDLGSTTGTLLDGKSLVANQPSRLNDGASFSLGPLDFYFLLDTPEGRKRRAAKHRAAVQHLVKNKKLSKAAAQRVLNQAGQGERDAAELTLQEGEVTVADWVDAVMNAKSGGGLVKIAIAVVVVAAVAVGILKVLDVF